MALTKAGSSVLSSVSVPAGGTKASPQSAGVSASKDATTHWGSELVWKLTNGGSAPGVAPTIVVQISDDSTNWYDYHTAGGDTVASSINSGAVPISRNVMYLRVVIYGNTTNAVTAEARIQATTSL